MNKNPDKIGKYKILDVIGRGAMGTVYKAMDPDIGRIVAIKSIRFDSISQESEREEMMKRFIREAQSAGKLIHPNIVTIYDVVRSDDMTYIVMQYIEGRNLQSCISSGEKIPVDKIVFLLSRICDALDYAHQKGVIHRDIKPANILLDEDGEPFLVDFGIARIETSTITQTGRTMGTPSYMSPEQVMGKKVSRCSDVFSLGVLLYEILTGKRPFHGESITTVIYKIINEEPFTSTVVRKSIPSGFESVISKALAKDPGKRYQSCQQLKKDLQEKAEQLPQKDFKKNKRFPWFKAALALVFVFGAVAVSAFYQIIHLPFLIREQITETLVESALPPPLIIESTKGYSFDLHKEMIENFDQGDYLKTAALAKDILLSHPEDETARKYLELAQNNSLNETQTTKISEYIKTGINHYQSGSYRKCIDCMKQVLEWEPENREAKKYIYLADTALSSIEIKKILEKQRTAEQQKDLESILEDIGSEDLSEQRKLDLDLLFNHYQDIQSIYSNINIEFESTRKAKAEFSHMLIAVYNKSKQKKVLFDGTKIWTMKKQGNRWKIIDNK